MVFTPEHPVLVMPNTPITLQFLLLEPSSQHKWLKQASLILESNSRNALSWIRGRVRNLLPQLPNIIFVHKIERQITLWVFSKGGCLRSCKIGVMVLISGTINYMRQVCLCFVIHIALGDVVHRKLAKYYPGLLTYFQFSISSLMF